MFPAVLQLQIGDSRWQRRSLIVLHLMAGSALLLAALPIAMRAVGMIGLLVSLLHSLKTRPAIRMRCQSDGSLLLDHGDRTEGAWRQLQLSRHSSLSPFYVVLRFSGSRERHIRSVLIPFDSVPPDDFRRLCIWLRWRARSDCSARLNSDS
jgi:toxin CptA